jgi:FkbM family methyltransferase
MKFNFKRIAKNIISKIGYEIIPNWQMKDRELATHLRDLFKALKIRCVLDVGANRGQYRDFLRYHLGYKGLILSFEPIPSLAKYLETKSANDPNWIIFPFALGSSDATLPINIMATDQFSSFLTPDHTLVPDYITRNKIEHQVMVNVHQVDTLMNDLTKNYPIENIYLKLDTQGFDLEVIKGAKKTLHRVMALQSEVSVLKIYDGMPNLITSIQFLNEEGFDLSGMFVVSRDKYLRVVEFDSVMINSKALT